MLEKLGFYCGLSLLLVQFLDFVLPRKIKNGITGTAESVTLMLDYTRPLRWLSFLARPIPAILWCSFALVYLIASLGLIKQDISFISLLGGALAALLDLNLAIAGAAGPLPYQHAMILSVLCWLVSVGVLILSGRRLVVWAIGESKHWLFFVRLLCFYAICLGLLSLVYWAIQFFDSWPRLVLVFVLLPVTWSTLVLNVPAWLLATLSVFLGVLEMLSRALTWIMYRIVEYSGGVFAAVIMLITVTLGVLAYTT